MGECILQRLDGTTARAPLGEAPVTIGRSSSSQIQIVDDCVSRNHCQVLLRDGQVVIRDLNSFNGTIVNGERVPEKVLSTGDRILLGETNFIFQLNAQMLPPEAPGGSFRRELNATFRVVSSSPQATQAPAARIVLPQTPQVKT